MFTGLIEEVGKVLSVSPTSSGMDCVIEAHTVIDDLKIGDSVSINGVCLTVTGLGNKRFTVQAVEETLQRTTLKTIKKGTPVNLERALKLVGRLGGHIVQGHIDGTGKITGRRTIGDNVLFNITSEQPLYRYIVEKGSIAVDGISLTVTFAEHGTFGVSVIPHTLRNTTLSSLSIGGMVNIETDIIAKYVEKLSLPNGSLTFEKLSELGF